MLNLIFSCEKVRSNYCPLGLFYGNQEMIKQALFSLLQSPQNNIRYDSLLSFTDATP